MPSNQNKGCDLSLADLRHFSRLSAEHYIAQVKLNTSSLVQHYESSVRYGLRDDANYDICYAFCKEVLCHFMRFQQLLPPRVTATFLVGVGGPVSVGKSTTAKILFNILSDLLAETKYHVEVVSTDAFLYSNAKLKAKGLDLKKGFPISYDMDKLDQFLLDLQKPKFETFQLPRYSHEIGDIHPSHTDTFKKPNILVIEGLNVLNQLSYSASKQHPQLTNLSHFSMYIDGTANDKEFWYVQRFKRLAISGLDKQIQHWQKYAGYSEHELETAAKERYTTVNLPNEQLHIHTTRAQAERVFMKDQTHCINDVFVNNSASIS